MRIPIYFLPGTMCDARLWSTLWAALAELDGGYEFIHLSIPVEKSIDNIVQVLAEILPKEKINLVGFSQGGYLASAFACQYPERIASLINLSNAPNKLPDEEVITRKKIICLVEAQGYSGITLARIKTFLDVSNHSNTLIIECIKAMDSDFGGNVLLQQLNSTTLRKNLLPQLFRLNIPMLFCFGDSDLLVNKAIIEQLAKTNACIKQQRFDHCGHMLPLEQPFLLAKALSFFIDSKLN